MTKNTPAYNIMELITPVKNLGYIPPTKTLKVCNLQIFIKVFVPDKPLQLIFMFVSKAGVYPSEAHLR